MLQELWTRWQQGYRTIAYPKGMPVLPDHYSGFPVIDEAPCKGDCRACVEVCPTSAIGAEKKHVKIDLGRCLFCNKCVGVCPSKKIAFGKDFRMAARTRERLLVDETVRQQTFELNEKIKKLFGRSLKLRQVSAGGCNACEADANVLGTVVFDMGRFGIQFVASPRHADGILVTGPVTRNMRVATQKTYDAVPAPKLVIASGACAIAGGPYCGHQEVLGGVDQLFPVDLYIPGCPPHPLTILDGLLKLMGRLS